MNHPYSGPASYIYANEVSFYYLVKDEPLMIGMDPALG